MEQRVHPRIQIPLWVELKHATFGTKTTVARDASEGGLFVRLDNASLPVGAKVQVTLQHLSLADTTATPTVQMQVQRVEEDGIGLSFVNKSYQHIWQSVNRFREDLAIGRDYFQVYQAGVVSNDAGDVLLAMEHGKWLFPGHYLVVGEDWRAALAKHFAELGLDNLSFDGCLEVTTNTNDDVPEAAALSLFHKAHGNCRNLQPGRYREVRWFGKALEIDALTFHDETLRELSYRIIGQGDGKESP